MRVLYIHLKKKWFNMFASGEKLEEYRNNEPYWQKRLFDKSGNPKQYDIVVFLSGYPTKSDENRQLCFANPTIRMGEGVPEWGAVAGKTYIVIRPGERLLHGDSVCTGCHKIYNEEKTQAICPHCGFDNLFD